ncbi:MAG: RNA polymerase sigma factor [Aestuariibaculum sp.]
MPTYKNKTKLIKKLRKGDEKAFAYLISTFHKPLYVYALSLSKDHAAAEDIVQTTFLMIWEYRKKLNIEFSIKNFLYKSTYNNFINHYNKKKAFSVIESAYMEAISESVSDDNSDILEKKIALVTHSIGKLPKKCKTIFLLSKKEGLTNTEIAGYLTISIKTVEAQISKAYRLIRQDVGNTFNDILFLILHYQTTC